MGWGWMWRKPLSVSPGEAAIRLTEFHVTRVNMRVAFSWGYA